ncbi:MAG: nucleotide-binding protein [Chloroflexi bacterium]|nr:nucleotide-binding protein [Chloroflexota bacterium]
MTLSPSQQRRLLGLLDRLARLKRGDPEAIQEEADGHSRFDFAGFGGQEHQDIVVLFHAGHIASRSFMGGDPASRWSPEGIYAYEITNDGEEYLDAYRHLLGGDPPQQQPVPNAAAKAFIIHGTDPNGYVDQVEDACRNFGLDPVRMMEQSNQGRTLPDKLRDNMSASDFYVAVLTHDETTIEGKQRARQNAIAETLVANLNWPGRLAILREDQVEIPSNLQGLAYIQLEGQWSMRLFQEFKASGLV